MKANESITSSSYSIDGLQQTFWSYVWGPQELEYANKNSGALTQNFSTDPRGRILSMSYQAPGLTPQELYFHYDALGNTTLLTDANSNPKASFQYDLHTGRLIQSWNPDNLEIINLEESIVGSINITASTAIGKDIILPPRQPPNLGGSTNGDNWGTAQVYVGGNAAGVQIDLTHPDLGKDCGDGLFMTQSRGFFAGISCYDWNGKFTDKDRKFFKDKMIETMEGIDFNNKAAEKSLNELKELIDKCCKEDMGDGANIRFKKMFNTETGRYSLEITVCCPPKHDCT